MKFSGYTFRPVALGALGWLVAATSSFGTILVNLDPAAALYDSDIKGVVNDGGTAGSLSGIPALTSTEHANGFTFNIAFTPTAADLSGTRLLIEIGANSNGSGLYLINGVPSFVGKQGATDAALPASLNDTALNTIAVQSSAGKLEAGIAYSYSVSWNQAGTLELKVASEGSSTLLDSFAISGTPGNWSGNNTLGVKTLARNNLGGLSGGNASSNFGPPFDVDNTSSLEGSVSRALFWNAHDVTALELTAPVIRGLAATKLPNANKVRLHWSVSEGGLPNPTTIVIKDAANTTVHEPSTLSGFVDIATTETNFTLTATNATGSTPASTSVEQDTSFTAAVRQDEPLAWYRFNETPGSLLFVDSAENAVPHNGELFGSAVSGANGFIDKAGAFEGTSAVVGDHILDPGSVVPVPVDPPTPRNGFTIEAVVKRRASPNTGNNTLISQTDVSGTGRVILGVNENGTIYSQLAGGPTQKKDADAKLLTDLWSHLVIVVDAGTSTAGTAEIRWYLDGKKIGTTLDGVNPNGSTFDPNFLLEASLGKWIFGSAKSLSSEFWKGDIDDIAVYAKLLDDPNGDGDAADSRIAAHRNAWYAETSGILHFAGTAATVNTGSSIDLTVKVGADVDAVSIDNGVGSVPLVDGTAVVSVSPTANTTYRVTATGPGGTYTRDFAVTYQQLTLPVLLGFEATTLPGQGKARLHWSVSAGAFVTPVTIQLKSGATVLHEATALNGHVDIDAAQATNLAITATNFIGPVNGTAAAPAADTPFSAEVRLDQPAAWFRFNEVTGSRLIVDSAENAVPHNGRPTGPAVSGATGFIDGAATFSGATGANAAAIITDRLVNLEEIEKGFTVEAIVRNEPGTGTTNRTIVAQQDLNGSGRGILTVDDAGNIRTTLAGGIRKDADKKFLGGSWSHLVLVADVETSEIRWYLDGEYAGTTKDGVNPDGTTFDPTTLIEASNGAWIIGAHKDLAGNFWKGQIDDIAVYDKLLDLNANAEIDAARIVAHHNAWRSETSGLLLSGLSSATIDPGQSTNLTLKVGGDITSASIDQGIGNVTLVNGVAVIPLNPTVTTTYQITLNGPNGPVVSTVIVTVNGTTVAPLRIISSSIESGNFVIRFEGRPSTVYNVRGSVDLLTFPEDHGTATTDAVGAGSASIPVAAGKARQFFRIESQQ